MNKKLFCYSKAEFDQRFNENSLPNDSCFISIIDSQDVQEYHQLNHKHKLSTAQNVINLQFDDVDDVEILEENLKAVPISTEQANRLVNFLEDNINKNIYIHCIAGRSRSQGVVRFILDMWPDEEFIVRKSNPCNTPNMKVVTELKRSFYRNYGFYN